jgi:hypothetical protein
MKTLSPQFVTDLYHWFDMIRDTDATHRDRALDAFWEGQLTSKIWLVEQLDRVVSGTPQIVIYGGWVGVLASLLFHAEQFVPQQVISVDLDPWCEKPARRVCEQWHNRGMFHAVTADMGNWIPLTPPDVSINTSTEHITQDTYDRWYNNVPLNTLVVAQGNNYYSCDEHVRCSSSLEQFCEDNRVTNPLWSGVLKTVMYDRYMAIWRKL